MAAGLTDIGNVRLLRTIATGPLELTLSLQIFLYLQILDVLTTALGFRIGLSEASPFIQYAMRLGTIEGLLISKAVAVGLAAFCVLTGRLRTIRLINYWYAALVIWNLTLILSV